MNYFLFCFENYPPSISLRALQCNFFIIVLIGDREYQQTYYHLVEMYYFFKKRSLICAHIFLNLLFLVQPVRYTYSLCVHY